MTTQLFEAPDKILVDGAGVAVMECWDFFFRAWNKSKEKMLSQGNVREASVWMVAGLTPAEAMQQATDDRDIPKGTSANGCFEIQGPQGIWSHVKGRKLDWSTPRRAKNVEFTSWDD